MKLKGLRWWILALTATVTFINILDRGTMNYMWNDSTKTVATETGATTAVVVQQGIANDLGFLKARDFTAEEEAQIRSYPAQERPAREAALRKNLKAEHSKTILSYMVVMFLIAYGTSQILFGKIFDKIGTRKGFALSAFVWGWAIVLTALSTGLKSIAFFRMLLGLAEAGPWPGTVKANAEWFPLEKRAIAQGVFGAASAVANMISPVLILFLFAMFGWRVTFVLLGALCLLWLVPWWVIAKTPPAAHPWITQEERDYILAGQPKVEKQNDIALSLGKLLMTKSSYAVILGRLLLDPIWWIFMTWLPIYLGNAFKMTSEQIMGIAWLPFVGPAISGVIGGWLAGRMIKRGRSVNYARKTTIAIGCGLMLAGMLCVAFLSPTPLQACFYLMLVLGGFQFAIVNIQTLPSDFHSGKTVASLAGLGGAAAVVGTIPLTLFVPMLTTGGNWTPLFILSIVLILATLFYMFVLAGKFKTLDDK